MSQGKPPWPQARIVKASKKVSATQKLVWLEHYGLANGRDGCTMSASQVGRRLAIHRSTVERTRQDLLNIGLLARVDRGAGRTASWYPQLPNGRGPQVRRLPDDDVQRYAEQLDTHIDSLTSTSLTNEGGRGAHGPETDHLTHPVREVLPVRKPNTTANRGGPNE